MKLTFAESGEMYLEWVSVHGAHSRQVADDFPADLKEQILDWCKEYEAKYRAEFFNIQTKKDIQFAINQLNERARTLE